MLVNLSFPFFYFAGVFARKENYKTKDFDFFIFFSVDNKFENNTKLDAGNKQGGRLPPILTICFWAESTTRLQRATCPLSLSPTERESFFSHPK